MVPFYIDLHGLAFGVSSGLLQGPQKSHSSPCFGAAEHFCFAAALFSWFTRTQGRERGGEREREKICGKVS